MLYAILKFGLDFSNLVKKDVERNFDKAVENLTNQDLEKVEEIKKIYKEFFYSEEAGDFVELFSETKPVIDKLSKKFKLVIWTNSSVENVKRDLSGLSLSRFSYILGGEDTGIKKPSGDGILLVCKELSVKPEEAVYIGDAVVDLRASKEAGCTSAVICRSKLLEKFLKDEKPDFILKNLTELVEKL
ncbi:MAG TPA: HAD-IA family hydrolase [archaeon]|nr:HAD-IA family hydrolase [archaeon]